MIEIKSRWESVTGKEKWAARGASFLAKVKATKVVWFPPEHVETGKQAAATAKKATKRATTKSTGAAKKATKKSTGAAKKATKSTKSVTSPVRRKKT